jgi:hypothetical protein
MSTVDWGTGRYEHTATRLEPAARVVVEAAAPVAGLVDVGCGPATRPCWPPSAGLW